MRYTQKAIEEILKKVSGRKISPAKAFQKLRNLSYESLGFARLDHHRLLRKGLPEVVYAPGKTLKQLEKITGVFLKKQNSFLITKLDGVRFKRVKRKFPKLSYSGEGQIAYLSPSRMFNVIASPLVGRAGQDSKAMPKQSLRLLRPRHEMLAGPGNDEAHMVAIVTAGTSDIPVAEEARITLKVLGRETKTFYDVGVAGLHRLLDHISELEKAKVIICVAGMEGALPSVLAGLVSKPVIAVPTSVGYGASFEGVAPLLTMLSSCVQGVACVNIDSGFSAACFAHLILNTSSALSRKGSYV